MPRNESERVKVKVIKTRSGNVGKSRPEVKTYLHHLALKVHRNNNNINKRICIAP